MQRAIAGGVLLGILGGILGGFLILRRLSLFGDTVGHSGMLGVVLAALFQFPTNWTLIIFTVVYGLGILYLIDRTNLNSDTILCIALASSISLGTIGLSFLRGYRGNLLSILLGDILSISNTDLILLLMLLSATIIWLGWTLPDQMLLTLNPDLAKVQGIPVQKYRYGFIIVLSLTIALTVRAVGILLMNGFLVIPAATAKILSRQFVPFLITAAAIGAMSAVIGMIISGAFDLPSGPTIVLVQLLGFLVTGFLSKGQS
ncbi:MAG TPA: metal ABC transporter permease [Xenococcaceae cyanobacterium]